MFCPGQKSVNLISYWCSFYICKCATKFQGFLILLLLIILLLIIITINNSHNALFQKVASAKFFYKITLKAKFIRRFYCSSVNVCLLLRLTIQIRLNYWLRLHYFLTNKTLSNLSTEDDPLMITYHFLIVMPFLQFLTSSL